MLLNGKQTENGTNGLKSGQRYKVKNLQGEWVPGEWKTVDGHGIFFIDGASVLFPRHVNEVMDIDTKEPQRTDVLDQALILLPGYEDKSWPDSEDPGFTDKLDGLKCDIQYAKELIAKFSAEHKAAAEKEMCLSNR